MTHEEMAAEVAKLFENSFHRDPKFTVRDSPEEDRPGVIIECGDMYEPPRYAGKRGVIGMLEALQKIGGGNRIDEYGETSSPGCETCDWGSFYTRSFIVWTEGS